MSRHRHSWNEARHCAFCGMTYREARRVIDARYRRRPEILERERVRQSRHRQRHPDREVARRAVGIAVTGGRLVRHPCFCGETRVQGHHYLGYAPEHRLDVQWLCVTHHEAAHHGN